MSLRLLTLARIADDRGDVSSVARRLSERIGGVKGEPKPLAIDPALNQVTVLPTEPPAKAVVIDGDALTMQDLRLRVRDDLPPGEYKVTLLPKALCPGNTEVKLPETNLTITVPVQLHVSLDLQKTPALGAKLPVTVTVRNLGMVPYKQAALLVSVSGPEALVVQADTGCHQLGSKGECTLNIGPKAIVKRQIVVQLPKGLNASQSAYTVDARITLPNNDTTISAEPAEFWLQAGSE
ncbi:MAG: hypothetical protein HYV03_05555 [Deltaproteobacteria bacterium]|nr:hypothetical protein [Deltaproteobacteria bacterium]